LSQGLSTMLMAQLAFQFFHVLPPTTRMHFKFTKNII
jgi:hypothetical protein